MLIHIKVFSFQFLVALLTFTVGVAAVLLWVVPRFRTVATPRASLISETLSDEELSLPAGWRRREISAGPPLLFRDAQQPEGSRKPEVRGRITIALPPDMEPERPQGDSFIYREAYRNRDILVVIGYGEIVTRRNEGDRRLNPCETPRFLQEQPSHRESTIEIDGRTAKHWVYRSTQTEFTTASICFPPDEQDVLLVVGAEYKNDGAFEIAQQIFTSIRFNDDR